MTAVPANTVFHAGDKIQLEVQANSPGYLYIISKGSSGTWKPMFPFVGRGGRQQPRRRLALLHAASEIAHGLRPADRHGADLHRVFAGTGDRPGKDDLLAAGRKAAVRPPRRKRHRSRSRSIMTASVDDAMVGRLRNTFARDLVIERVDENTSAGRAEERDRRLRGQSDGQLRFAGGGRSRAGAPMIRGLAAAALGARSGSAPALAQSRTMQQGAHRMEITLERLENEARGTPSTRAWCWRRATACASASTPTSTATCTSPTTAARAKYGQLFPREETGQDNHIAAGQGIPGAGDRTVFRIAGPAGYETVYWLVSPARRSARAGHDARPPSR